MKSYKHIKLRNLGPRDGFYIYTPDGRTLKDLYPQFIVRELNRLSNRIKRLELAGHHLSCWLDQNTPLGVKNDWNKAKEDKV